MNITDMPSASSIVRGQQLAMECYRAIQQTRLAAERQPGSAAGDELRAFFMACAELCPKADPEAAKKKAAAEDARVKAEVRAAKEAGLQKIGKTKKAGSDPATGKATNAAGGRRSTK
jgi:hypothetical protein